MLDAHIESGADITCVCTESGQFVENATYFTVNEAGRITETRCAPHKASGCRSLEIYLLSRDLLISLVDECAAQDKYSFRSDVLCAMGDKLDLRAFLWDGFAAQLRTVQEYYERSMQLLDPAIRSELLCAERPILAKEDDEAASYIAPDSRCVNSLIADGCQIEGNVEGSILFPGVKVGKGSQVKNCILFKNTVVEEGVTLGCVITGQGMALLYSLTGGLFAYAGMLALRRWFSGRQLWILSVFCAMAHNFGQLCAAALVARTRAVWYYLPVLLPAAILAGALTGLCTQLLLQRLGRAGLLPADKKQEEEANG